MLQEYLNQPGGREKQIYLPHRHPGQQLLHDFRHILNLVTNNDEAYFTRGARNLGIHSIRRYFVEVEKKMLGGARDAHGEDDVAGNFFQLEELLHTENLFDELVVQRRRPRPRQRAPARARQRPLPGP